MTAKTNLNPNQWIDLYGDYLYGFAVMKVSNHEIARDLVQDTFVAGLNNMSTFRGEAAEKTWLVSILKRKIIDHYRKNSKNKEFSIDEGYKPFADYNGMKDVWIANELPKEWNNIEKKLEESDFKDVLKDCLKRIPENLRSAFLMKNIDEIESKEICKALNISTSNLWVMLHRCRLALRKCFEKQWV